MLRVLHCEAPGDDEAPVAALRDEFRVAEDVDHEDLEGGGGHDGTEAGFGGGVAGAVAGDAGDDDVEGLGGGEGRGGEGGDDLAGFEEGAGPALDEEEGDGGGGGGRVVGEVEDLGAVAGDVELDFVLLEFLVDLCLCGGMIDQREEWGKRL